MAEKAQEMLNGSLDAMVNLDTELAQKVCTADDEVDAMNREAYSLVEERIRQNPEQLNSMIQFLSASRYLERVADHATNIAEDVIYLVKGEIIRHTKKNTEEKPEYSG
jgi:phosphate transport system protein